MSTCGLGWHGEGEALNGPLTDMSKEDGRVNYGKGQGENWRFAGCALGFPFPLLSRLQDMAMYLSIESMITDCWN